MKKLTKAKIMIGSDLARRFVEFHDGKSYITLRLWGLANWGDISKLVREGVVYLHQEGKQPIIDGQARYLGSKMVGKKWYYPSDKFLNQVVLPFIEIYRKDDRPDRNQRWFEGDLPNEIWNFEPSEA